MSGNILATLGISQEAYDAAKESTVTEAYEVMPSGVYDSKVKEVILYTNKFGGETLKINVTVKHNDQERTLSFRDDIGKNLKQTEAEKAEGKPGKINEGFLSRLKSLSVATNVPLDSIKEGEQTKVNSYGSDCPGKFLLGFNDKPVKALVRHSQDSNKAEGEAYRDSNDIEGIANAGSEDIEKFQTKVEKLQDGIFKFKGYVKANSKNNNTEDAGSEDAKAAAEKINF